MIENYKPADVTNTEENTDYYSNHKSNKETAKNERSRQRDGEAAEIVFEVFIDALSVFLYILGNAH